jgi:hypothetical protein
MHTLYKPHIQKTTLQKSVTVHLFDSIMGSGKTTGIHKLLGQSFDNGKRGNILYISPLLSEVGGDELLEYQVTPNLIEGVDYDIYPNAGDGIDVYCERGRVQKMLPQLDFKYLRTDLYGSKKAHFISLIKQGKNISATHAIFKLLTVADLKDIKEANYTVIIDEVVSVIEDVKISQVTRTLLDNAKLIDIDPLFKIVSWEGNKTFNNRDYQHNDGQAIKNFAQKCLNTEVYIVNNTAFISFFPYPVLEAFNKVILMTYLFDGSLMSKWLEIHGAYIINQTHHINWLKSESFIKQKIKVSIDLYTPTNEIGFSLSQSAYLKHTNKNRQDLMKALERYADVARKGNEPIKNEEHIVTCPKTFWDKNNKKNIMPTRLSKAQWLSSTTKATNQYSHYKSVIYALSKHKNPYYESLLRYWGTSLDNDLFAVAEMLQLIWRGCIRNDERMKLFIVCPKMRKLFTDWLNSSGKFK